VWIEGRALSRPGCWFRFDHDEAWPSDHFGTSSQDSLYPSHLSILQHHFDAVWMRGALGQNARDNTGRQGSSALILLLDNLHPQTGADFTALGWRHKLTQSPSYHWQGSRNTGGTRSVASALSVVFQSVHPFCWDGLVCGHDGAWPSDLRLPVPAARPVD
jgi:hypothetical protein